MTFDAEAFLRDAPLVPVELDAETGRVRHIGPQAEALLGVPPEEWKAEGFWRARVVPDDQAALLNTRAAVARGGGPRAVDYRIDHAEGRVIWVCETLAAAPGDGALVGYLMDITDRKRQEVALWKSEERLRALLRATPDAMVLTDMEGRILEMNDQAEALFGYGLADVVGSSFDLLVPERVRVRLPELRGAFDRDPQRRSLVDGHGFAIERRDGTEVPAELSMGVFTAADDSRQLLCSVRDLTARRRVEAQLRSSEQRLREMANALPAMVCFVDTGNRFRFVNDAYARWHGWERHQMEGRLLREVIGEQLFRDMRDSIAAALEGTPAHFRGSIAGPGGRSVPVDVSLVPQQNEDGTVSGYFVVIFDVTHEVAASEADRRHRDELAHVSRVATLGELAASIAHELNQPLSAVVANARAAQRLLERTPPDLEEVADALEDIAAAGNRAGDVISSMRELLQHGESRDEAIDLHALVQDVIALLGSESIGRGVTISAARSGSGLSGLRGDSIQLKQVVLNLVMNAIEAASRAPAGERRVDVTVSARGRELQVEVRDTGPGLPTDDPEELFAPFVSRRADGLGMGLAISRSIAEAHDGRIWGENHPEGGAVFRLRLPIG